MLTRISMPLDSLMMSGHAEYMAIIPGLVKGNEDLLATETGTLWAAILKEGKMMEIGPQIDPGIPWTTSINGEPGALALK